MKKRARIYQLSLVLAATLMAVAACDFGGGNGDQPAPPPTSTPSVSGPIQDDPPDPGGQPAGDRSTEDLARATVQILALVRVGDGFQAIWTGSGSIIDSNGLILTNAHVVDNRWSEYTDLGVSLIDRADQAPELTYLAEIVAIDYSLDLAVIRIISDMEGLAVSPSLPTVALGDSDLVELGGTLRIFGYPGIGGETITFTTGAVSGFTSERGIDGRAWIKTDATIAGGNSGGMAVDDQGRLIGIPTLASAGAEQENIVDCRPVADTNRDGVVNEQDTCVPLGGFINGLRPVNLALPVIEAARQGQQYVAGGSVEPQGGYDLEATFFYNLQFSTGATADDRPEQVVAYLPGGSMELCIFWDYEGLADGMDWSAIWFVDREFSEAGSILNASWNGGNAGSWWACIFNDNGLPDGTFEVSLEVEGEVLASESIFVGGQRQIRNFELSNQSSETICYAFLSPSMAQNWGQDELGPQEILYTGDLSTFLVVTGEYDLLLMDCSYTRLVEEYNINISGDGAYTLND
jgi:S1-C subfamily serine protease